jgi:hypothetical protein
MNRQTAQQIKDLEAKNLKLLIAVAETANYLEAITDSKETDEIASDLRKLVKECQ